MRIGTGAPVRRRFREPEDGGRVVPGVSVVVPTRNEAGNIKPLLAGLDRVLRGVAYEVVFVDDSDDVDTVATLEATASDDGRVRFEHREAPDGLAGAVMRGFQLARGSVIVVMDADLQHPPDVLATLLARVNAGFDLVVGSRFVRGGDDGGLDPVRKLVSFTARASIWAALGRARRLHDPTSGCFAIRRAIAQQAPYRATGWKVLLEVLPLVEPERIGEVPLCFGTRRSGQSKLSGRQAVDLYRQLWRLARQSPDDRRFYLFALVGLSGVLVNMLVFLAASRLGLIPELAAPIAATVAMVSNFTWNDLFTYRDRRAGGLFGRATRAMATQVVGIAIDTGVVALTHAGLGLAGILANLLGIGAAAGWNYGLFSAWVWRRAPRAIPAWSVPQEVSQKS